MGLSASQARYVFCTSRMSAIEYEAQRIESDKIQLATQRDDLYQEYCKALDATKIQVAYMCNSKQTYVDATFSNLTSYDPYRVKQYALKDTKSGKIIVEEDVAKNYEVFNNDKYAFAYAMMGFSESFNFFDSATNSQESGIFIGIGKSNDGGESCGLKYIKEDDGRYSLYMSECEQKVYDEVCESDPTLKAKYEDIDNPESMAEKQKALEAFRDALYQSYGKEIFEYMNLDKSEGNDFNNAPPLYEDKDWGSIEDEFNHYVRLWESIQQAGGCKAIDKGFEDGELGNEWLNNMVNAGAITIQVYDEYNSKTWTDTSVATSIGENCLKEIQDEKDLKKVETEYEYNLEIINAKDKDFDNNLNMLESERQAIEKQMDAIKGIAEKNIENTFKIFS